MQPFKYFFQQNLAHLSLEVISKISLRLVEGLGHMGGTKFQRNPDSGIMWNFINASLPFYVTMITSKFLIMFLDWVLNFCSISPVVRQAKEHSYHSYTHMLCKGETILQSVYN